MDLPSLNEITLPTHTKMVIPGLVGLAIQATGLTTVPWPVLTTLDNNTETRINFLGNQNNCSQCESLLPLIAWVRGTNSTSSWLGVDCAVDPIVIADSGYPVDWRQKSDCLGTKRSNS